MPVKKLRVRIGPDLDTKKQKTYNVNDDFHPIFIDSPHFCGNICMRVNGFNGIRPKSDVDGSCETSENTIQTSDYFKGKKRCFSLQIEGRFKQKWSADDIHFGIVLDKKLKLPMGSDLALKIAQMIDPGLKADIHADKPWTMSPLLCAMNIFNVEHAPIYKQATMDSFVSCPEEIRKDSDETLRNEEASTLTSQSYLLPEWKYGGEKYVDEENTLSVHGKPMGSEARKKYFLKQVNRKAFEFTPDKVYGFDFYNKYLDLGELKIKLPGFSINMEEHWTDYSIRYVCRSADASCTFFVIELDLVD